MSNSYSHLLSIGLNLSRRVGRRLSATHTQGNDIITTEAVRWWTKHPTNVNNDAIQSRDLEVSSEMKLTREQPLPTDNTLPRPGSQPIPLRRSSGCQLPAARPPTSQLILMASQWCTAFNVQVDLNLMCHLLLEQVALAFVLLSFLVRAKHSPTKEVATDNMSCEDRR